MLHKSPHHNAIHSTARRKLDTARISAPTLACWPHCRNISWLASRRVGYTWVVPYVQPLSFFSFFLFNRPFYRYLRIFLFSFRNKFWNILFFSKSLSVFLVFFFFKCNKEGVFYIVIFFTERERER